MMITASDFTGGIKAIPSDTINIPGPQSKYNGLNTAQAAGKLTDSGGKFLVTRDAASGTVTNQGVQVGDVVYNTTTANPRIAYVTAIDSATTLSLSADIFPVTDPVVFNAYRIYRGNGVNLTTDVGTAKAFQIYCGGTTDAPALASDVYVTTIDGDFVFFEDVQPGEILPVAVCRVNVGAAPATGNGNVNTLTTATARFVALT